jgi:hypothetical protein
MLKHFGDQLLLKSLKLVALAVICGSLASADVLYWVDYTQGTGVVPGGITKAGLTGVAATSDDNFDTLLTTKTWDAVIISLQNSALLSLNPSILPDLISYVNKGGRLIGSDWYEGDTGFYALFQAGLVDVNNPSVTNDGSALFNAITGDIGLANPNLIYGTFDRSYSAQAGGTGFGPSGTTGGFGIIQGNNGRTFLNGPLTDTYVDVSQGQQLIANELTGSAVENPVPEPATFVLLLGAVGGLMLIRKNKKQIS